MNMLTCVVAMSYLSLRLIFGKVKLDEEHLELYPFCGKLFGYQWHDAKSRIVNSIESETQYPWVVLIRSYWKVKTRRDVVLPTTGNCGGTVIGWKHVVTAAHCICPGKREYAIDKKNHRTHELSVCKKSSNHNQIKPGFNEAKVRGGHMDKDILRSSENIGNSFHVAFAFVKFSSSSLFGSKIYNDDLIDKDDLAVLITDRPLFDMEKLKNAQYFDRPPIVPICLAAENSDINNEKLFGVGWGLIYDKTSVKKDKDPYYTSCMTNEVGPKDWTFQPCDMSFVKNNNWACAKKSIPLGKTGLNKKDWRKCRKYFAKARRDLDELQIKALDDVDKIYIHSQNDPNAPFLTCYNEKQFSENGWCEVHQELTSTTAWGFCSPSCADKFLQALTKEDYNRVKSPKVYHEIEWMVDTKAPNPCSEAMTRHKLGDFDYDYNICMKGILPRANVGHFKLNGPDIELIAFKKEYVTNSKLTSYIAICDGDSGSGHWVTIDEDASSYSHSQGDENEQRALVAVVVSAVHPYYETSDGKLDDGVCGGIVKGKQGKVEAYAPIAINTIHKDTLGFIKKWALKCKSYGHGMCVIS